MLPERSGRGYWSYHVVRNQDIRWETITLGAVVEHLPMGDEPGIDRQSGMRVKSRALAQQARQRWLRRRKRLSNVAAPKTSCGVGKAGAFAESLCGYAAT